MSCPINACYFSEAGKIAGKARFAASGRNSRQGPQRGMSLVELMVAMGLGLFLITGVVNVFLSNKRSIQVETSLARLQENGRMALDMLVSDVRNAMYLGCSSTRPNLKVMSSGATYTAIQGFERHKVGWKPALPAGFNTVGKRARRGSDVLRLQRAAIIGDGLAPSVDVAAGDSAVSVAKNPGCLKQGDQVVIASCASAHLFTITNKPACGNSATSFTLTGAGNDLASISPGYTTSAEIFQFFDTTWYVRDTRRKRLDGDIAVYALGRHQNGGAWEEMVEGVEYMQILYGQQLAGGNMRYVPASDAALNLARVVSVRIALLMQSFEPILESSDSRAYQVLDQSIGSAGTTYTHGGDRSLRRVFTTTAMLRNRAL